MSDGRTGERAAVNWRGPLLAAAIFAGVFAVLLLMAHQNEANTSDEGSSLREDPYGSSLLFDAFQRAGYAVVRSQEESSLAEQNAAETTAFFVGGYPQDDDTTDNGQEVVGGKFRGRLEDFLARGGRAVLLAPDWTTRIQSESQGWEIGVEWKKAKTPAPPPEAPVPGWAVASGGALPDGSEKMYLANDAPWLKTDSGWTTLYAGPENMDEGTAGEAAPPAHVYLAMRKVGKGELIAASQESFLLNETIKTHPNPTLLDFLAGGRREIWVDETLHGLQQEQGVLWLVERYRLQAALLLFWVTLLALLWSLSGELVRRPARDRTAAMVREGEHAGVAAQRLLRRSVGRELVAAECWEQFRRRSPHDAEAITGDAARAARLRAALAQPPVQGYRELRALVAERRATARHPARTGRDRTEIIPAMPGKNSREERIV